MSDYEIRMLNKPVLIKIVKEQQEIINKAIEYVDFVKSYSLANTLNEGYIDVDKLLNILKGENNEN